jgi:threonine dehydrogenase-like Zn-dependent dehydrogenase
MQAVVFHGIGDIRLESAKDPKLHQPTDAIVKLTSSAICGTDLHMIRGTMPGMKPGTILGHEGVGIVEEVGKAVRNLKRGDRVVIPSTIACGYCSYCRAGYTAQCDHANPNGPSAGTAFYGGPAQTGPFDGLQAEYARIAFANVNALKLPPTVSDAQAILISDIFPTGYFGAELAEVKDGDTVAVFGCGPVGLFAIASARLLGARRVFAIDHIESRLEMARSQGAEVINYDTEHPLEVLKDLTGGIGPDRVIDAVGVDAERPHSGPAQKESSAKKKEFEKEQKEVAPKQNPKAGNWEPGDAPSQVLQWAVQGVCKAGTISIIGVYPETARTFPIGEAMEKNLTIKGGNCNHLKYEPMLIRLVASGAIDPTQVLTQTEPMSDVIEAYKAFDQRQPGWIKVQLKPAA